MDGPATDPRTDAERVLQALWPQDAASRMLGIAIEAIGPGHAVAQMTVRDDMLNGHGICHGGITATLADTAFAYACNARGVSAVASGFSIELLAPARLGDLLTATCTEQHRGGRSGVYDVEVVDQCGERVAIFRGRSVAVARPGAPPAGAG
ncbi:MAG: hydroxyphenylacetyl-CoA thioesterase PaaI [Burkholderiales bacterium]|nr:hydroxyphenylacetyl-CoA thioesterase PaaI [Burkholderiales bacterium]